MSEHTTSQRDRGVTEAYRPRTDGGTESQSARQSQFRALFVDVTGVEECVDKQESRGESRYVDADSSSVAAAVEAVTSRDGLGDTIDDAGAERFE
jgi:hypothetical protein